MRGWLGGEWLVVLPNPKSGVGKLYFLGRNLCCQVTIRVNEVGTFAVPWRVVSLLRWFFLHFFDWNCWVYKRDDSRSATMPTQGNCEPGDSELVEFCDCSHHKRFAALESLTGLFFMIDLNNEGLNCWFHEQILIVGDCRRILLTNYFSGWLIFKILWQYQVHILCKKYHHLCTSSIVVLKTITFHQNTTQNHLTLFYFLILCHHKLC